MSNMLYYLVDLVGRLLRVRGARDSGVTVFAFRTYAETTGIILRGDISYGPRAMPHNSLLHVTLCIALLVLYSTSWLHLLPASCHHERPSMNPPPVQPTTLEGMSTEDTTQRKKIVGKPESSFFLRVSLDTQGE